MNKIDFIYLKLCEKYGNLNIFLRRDIKHHIDMVINEDNVWEESKELGISLGPIEFWKYEHGTIIKIDLKEEQLNGTFEN